MLSRPRLASHSPKNADMETNTEPVEISDTTKQMLADPNQAMRHIAIGIAQAMRVIVGGLMLKHPEHAEQLGSLLTDPHQSIELHGQVLGGAGDISLEIVAHFADDPEPVPLYRHAFISKEAGQAAH